MDVWIGGRRGCLVWGPSWMSVGGIVVDVPFRGRRAARPGSLTPIFKKSEFLGNRQNGGVGQGSGS